MRLSELAEQSGASIPTIKFYLREGLLPPGRPVSARQSEYDAAHLDRLRLVRALVDVGGLSLAAVRQVLVALEGPHGVDVAVAIAHGALSPQPATEGPYERAVAAVRRLGWQVDETSAAMARLEAALAAVEAVGLSRQQERVDTFGAAAMACAEFDVAGVTGAKARDPQAVVASVVLGTVLTEELLLALRLLAQSDAYRRRR